MKERFLAFVLLGGCLSLLATFEVGRFFTSKSILSPLQFSEQELLLQEYHHDQAHNWPQSVNETTPLASSIVTPQSSSILPRQTLQVLRDVNGTVSDVLPVPDSNNKDRDDTVTAEFLLFLRISKTASTSFLQFFHNAKLYSANDLLPEVSQHLKRFILTSRECSFSTFEARKQLQRTQQQIPMISNYSRKEMRVQCTHQKLSKLLERFQEVVQSGLLSHHSQQQQQQQQQQERFLVHPITIVRDPFERLVSLFYYIQRNYPHWTASKKQDVKILDNDLAGWMDVLYQEGGSHEIAVPHQFDQISKDPTIATHVISKQGPMVSFLAECFDVSLQLLAEIYPSIISRPAVDRFLNSSSSQLNKRQSTKTATEQQEQERILLDTLRQRHMERYPQDWNFYLTAVSIFEEMIQNSTTVSLLDKTTCQDTLSTKYGHLRNNNTRFSMESST